MIVTFENDAEATFTELLDDLVAIREMLIEATQVFVRVGIETIVRLVVEHAHL